MIKNKENFFTALILFAAFALGWGASDCADLFGSKCNCDKKVTKMKRNYNDRDMNMMQDAVERRMQGVLKQRMEQDWKNRERNGRSLSERGERGERKQRPEL